MNWALGSEGILFGLLALAALPFAHLRLAALWLLHRLLMVLLAVAVAICALFHFRPAAVPDALGSLPDKLADHLKDEAPIFRLARSLGWAWLLLGCLIVLAGVPLLARVDRARRLARQAVRQGLARSAAGSSTSAPAWHTAGTRLVKDLLEAP